MTYKEGELLSDHLKADGALVEVKIPAECTVNTNQQVRARPCRSLRTSRIRRLCVRSTSSAIGTASGRTGRRRTNPPARPTIPIFHPTVDLEREGKTRPPREPTSRIARNSSANEPRLSPHRPRHPSPHLTRPLPSQSSSSRQVRSRQLWGTDVYTGDSDVVAALMHTGFWLPGSTCPPQLLELVATARAVTPAEQYSSTSRNGIRSRSWGRVLTGFSYKVEACRAITVNNQTIELTGDPERIKPCAPTFFPNVVESVVNTRASQANAERRQRLIQEVTIQYNLCNEPWLKYSVASVCDRGFKRSEWTSARLRRETLYLETHTRRYELSYDGPVFDEEEENYEEVNAPEADVYRWGRCSTPKDLRRTAELGVPLPSEELVDVVQGVKWHEIGFDLNSVTIQGVEYKVVRLQWLPRIEPGGELHEDE